MPTSMPYVRPMRPESSSRISDLLLRRGDDRANALAREGAISGQMWSGIANTIGNVAQAWATGRENEQAEAETRRTRDEASQIDEAIRLTPRDESGRTDPAAVAREIEHIDPVKALDWWRRADDTQRAQLASERDLGERVAKAAGSLVLDLERTHPTQRQAKWTTARQQAIDGGLTQAEQMPEQVDMGWLRQTFDQARSVESIAKEVQALGEQEEEEYTLSPGEKRFRGTDEIASVDPRAPEPAGAGTFEAIVDSLAEERGRPLTQREILDARRQWTDAGRAEPREPGGISQAQRAAAIRWRDNEKRIAQRVHREATEDLDPIRYAEEDQPKMEAAKRELEDELARIELSYREQIADTSTDIPGGPPPGAPGRPRAAAPPPPVRPMASHEAPPPTPAVTTAPSPRAATASPRTAMPKVGDVVTVRGQRVRITAVSPDGRIEGEPVP